MSILAIGSTPLLQSMAGIARAGSSAGSSAGAGAASGTDFGQAMAKGLENVQKLQSDADNLAVQAATGDLQDVHDYTIAAAQASLATEMTVTMRNKAVEAFNEILRMPL